MKIFESIGSNAVFYGQVLLGSQKPRLMYMTTYADMKDYFVVITTYEGTNSFGATVKESVKSKVTPDGNFIEFFK